MKEASFYKKLDNEKSACYLCPHNCTISEGKRGICDVRINKEGILYSEVYNHPVAIHTDPIEKKPLYHFYPGGNILSIGTAGCNMKCFFCQNCDISQSSVDAFSYLKPREVQEIIALAANDPGNLGVAYTYNEPTIYFEYMYDIASGLHDMKMKNVVVTNGFINDKPLEKLLELTDAFNVDLKAFNETFYRRHTSSRLKPVLESIKTIYDAGVHLELTNLIIPGLNDDEKEFAKMIRWIRNETSENTVLHLSRYFPRYKSVISSTPGKTLNRFYDIAKEYLNYVYIGNIESEKGKNTYCPNCRELLINRRSYSSMTEGLDHDGSCTNCGMKIINEI